jgi:very-short-patch-repair endonuclease
VTLPDNLKRNWALLNKIDRKSVDFVLFDKSTLNPAIAIELDGSSHNSFSRQERDSFVDQVFSTAGVPLIHVRRNDVGYNANDISTQIMGCLSNNY